MTHTLVTFLGRGRGDPNTGYSKARYRFPDATESTTAFFGLALAKHLAPDRIVILGTRASQWGVLAVENADVESEDENTLLESLMDSADGENVDQALLDKVEEIMSRMVGIAVTPRLIPFGKDESEQYEILSTVADAGPTGEVSFDRAAGFRHLVLVGFLSAFLLERVRNL